MATISTSVRAGIAAMLTAGILEGPAALTPVELDRGNGTPNGAEIMMARSGYIVVAG